MVKLFIYPEYEDIINKHDDEVIKKSGGMIGVLDEGLIRSAIEFIKNDLYYRTFEDKLTHLVYSLAKNHGFIDGNKRTAIVTGAYFLELNAFDQYVVDVFIREMENAVLLTVRNILTKDELRRIISDYINLTYLSDETSLIYVKKLEILASNKIATI
jgi:death-on-curing family protein